MKLQDIKPGMVVKVQRAYGISTHVVHHTRDLTRPPRGRVYYAHNGYVTPLLASCIIAARQPYTLFNWFPRWEVVE